MGEKLFSKEWRRRRLAEAAVCGFAALAAWSGWGLWRAEADYRRGAEDMERVYALASEAAGGWMGESGGDRPGSFGGDAVSGDGGAWESGNGFGAPGSVRSGGGMPTGTSDGEGQAGFGVPGSAQSGGRQAVCRKLAEANPDTVGWLEIPDTPVSYPVMHTPENPDFYLTHGFDKKPSACGMIYLDGNEGLADSRNLLFYGHHMKNGTMFASLVRYEAEDYWKKHPVIYLDTMDETRRFEIFAVLKLSEGEVSEELLERFTAEMKEDYDGFLAWTEERRLFDTGIRPRWPERLATLVTCEYSQKDGRLFVVGRELSKKSP